MTINELLNLPIHKMKDWLGDNFIENMGDEINDYVFFNLHDSFGIEFPNDCGWKIIPAMTTYVSKDNFGRKENVLYQLSRCHNYLLLSVLKESKFGEVLIYTLIGNIYKTKRDKYGFDLNRIEYNYCNCSSIVFVDGPTIVNNSPIALHYKFNDEIYKNSLKLFEGYEFLDEKYYSVRYTQKPIVGGISKNKHTLQEYADSLESFAQSVSSKVTPFYYTNMDLTKDKQYIDKCKKLKVNPNEVFDLWIGLYAINQDVTIDDTLGIIRLSLSGEARIKEYRDRYKCKVLDRLFYDKLSLCKDHYFNPYHLCLLLWKKSSVDVENYAGYLKNLKETRRLYQTLDIYRDIVKTSKLEYTNLYKKTALKFETEIIKVWDEVAGKLEGIKNKYISELTTIEDNIHKNYPEVNDSDVGILEKDVDILDDLKNAFSKTSTIPIKLLDPGYKKQDIQPSQESQEMFSEAFKNHANLLFDASPDLKEILYYEIWKCEDAPYSLGSSEQCGVSDEAIYDYEEKYGVGSFKEYKKLFKNLAPKESTEGCDDIFPGQSILFYITRDLDVKVEDPNDEC